MRKRLYHFDSAKFLLIFLMVFGHMMESNRGLSYNGELYGCIYLFHMPLFILISGFFSKKYDDVNLFWRNEFRLMETLLVFHIGSHLFKVLVYGHGIGLADITIPGYGSWYLLSLIYWRAILQFTPSKVLDHKWLLPLCLAVSLLGGYVPVGGVLSIQRTFTFLPFFVLGYLIKERCLIEKVRLYPWAATVILVVIMGNVFALNYLAGGGTNTIML